MEWMQLGAIGCDCPKQAWAPTASLFHPWKFQRKRGIIIQRASVPAKSSTHLALFHPPSDSLASVFAIHSPRPDDAEEPQRPRYLRPQSWGVLVEGIPQQSFGRFEALASGSEGCSSRWRTSLQLCIASLPNQTPSLPLECRGHAQGEGVAHICRMGT